MTKRPTVPGVRFVRLSKSGSSLVVAVPRELREQLQLRVGDVLESWLEQRENGRVLLVFTRAASARVEG